MKRSRHTEEQIIAILKEQEAGSKTADVCRKHGISEATFYKWRSRYGGMELSDAREAPVALSLALLDAHPWVGLRAALGARRETLTGLSGLGDLVRRILRLGIGRAQIQRLGRHALLGFHETGIERLHGRQPAVVAIAQLRFQFLNKQIQRRAFFFAERLVVCQLIAQFFQLLLQAVCRHRARPSSGQYTQEPKPPHLGVRVMHAAMLCLRWIKPSTPDFQDPRRRVT